MNLLTIITLLTLYIVPYCISTPLPAMKYVSTPSGGPFTRPERQLTTELNYYKKFLDMRRNSGSEHRTSPSPSSQLQYTNQYHVVMYPSPALPPHPLVQGITATPAKEPEENLPPAESPLALVSPEEEVLDFIYFFIQPYLRR